MGKTDDLQRMRAEQHARLEREAKRREEEAKQKPPPPPPPPVVVPAPPDPDAPIALVPVSLDVAQVAPENEQRAAEKRPGKATASAKKVAAKPGKAGAAGEETGRCSACGKIKPVSRGLVAAHQKGLGKACEGSRKPPA